MPVGNPVSNQNINQKIFGKYRGIVVDNNDPENLGRLKVSVPSLLGNELVTGWAMPCVPYGGAANCGFVAIPDVDAGVWIEFEEGELEFPIWVGTYWSKPGGTTDVPEPANAQGPPTSKIFKTNKHTIELADEDGEELIKILEYNKNEITIDAEGIVVTDANKNVIHTKDGSIFIQDSSGKGFLLKDGKIQIGSEQAMEPLVLGTKLIMWLATHTHPSAMGPTGPPAPPPTPTDFCSQFHNTE